MNLNQLQTALTAIGVTLNGGDDDPDAFRAILPGQRTYRASLYLRRLEATRTFLTTTLNQPVAPPPAMGIGPAYGFAQTALGSTALINGLALELDKWVVPAVINALRQPPAVTSIAGYQNYFLNNILNINNATFDNNVNNFFAHYLFTGNALDQIARNFRQNIREACIRIYDDHTQNRIRDLFIGQYPGLTLLELKAIKSTGSDFHKGGKQVLILTFAARWQAPPNGALTPMDLRVVYKPSDLEVDCLLVGNSAAVNNVVNGFMNQSLAEIFNAHVALHPGPGQREQLPTYRILPRRPTSGAPAGPVPGPPIPVRQAYGYIEFLAHETSYSWGLANNYRWGVSDFLIFQHQDPATIIPRCYRQFGHLLAIACTFSLGDLHIENVRITKYLPYLIDLEISLTELFNVTNTLLLIGPQFGGINGEMNPADTFAWVVQEKNTGTPNQRLDIGPEYVNKYFQNRLYALRPGLFFNRRLVQVQGTPVGAPGAAYWLLTGLRLGMDVLREIQQSVPPGFNAWFARLANSLVRVIPVTTQGWITIRRRLYETMVMNAPAGPAVPVAATINNVMRDELTFAFQNYQAAPTPEPEFIAYIGAAATDLQNFDIPVFYHRVGTTDIVDSNGIVMAVPPQVTVDNPNPPPPTLMPATGLGPNYYAAAPTTARIQNGQVAALAGPGFNQRRLGLRDQAMTALNILVPPGHAGALIP